MRSPAALLMPTRLAAGADVAARRPVCRGVCQGHSSCEPMGLRPRAPTRTVGGHDRGLPVRDHDGDVRHRLHPGDDGDLAVDVLFRRLPVRALHPGAARETGFTTRARRGLPPRRRASVGHFEPPPAVGEIGLQDIRECLTARSLPDGTILVFLEDPTRRRRSWSTAASPPARPPPRLSTGTGRPRPVRRRGRSAPPGCRSRRPRPGRRRRTAARSARPRARRRARRSARSPTR